MPLAPAAQPGQPGGPAGRAAALPRRAAGRGLRHRLPPDDAASTPTPTPCRLAWRDEHRIRRYGFHGTSYAFVSRRAAELLGRPVEDTNLVVLHLGNGASAAAVRGGRSVDTSMGFTPLEGLVMGTRSGDLDPAIHGHLHRELGWSLDEIDRGLYRESGLRGLSGRQRLPRAVPPRAAGDEAATLAFDVYAYRVRKYVGAYYAALGELHAVVFTGGVGQHSAELRAAALDGLFRLGIVLDARSQRGRCARTPAPSRPTAPRSPSSSSPPTRSGRSPARRSRSCAPRARSGQCRARGSRHPDAASHAARHDEIVSR